MVLRIAPDIGHELLSFCRQIAAGLDYLSKKHFVYRDLAAKNILLSDDYVCKVCIHTFSYVLVAAHIILCHCTIVHMFY